MSKSLISQSQPSQDIPIYQLSTLSFIYPLADNGISLCGDLLIYRGDCVLLDGMSGCGKSTLLQALKGLIPNYIRGNYHGDIQYNGQAIESYSETELIKIAYLQQNPDHQLICPSVVQELAFALENLHYSPTQIQQKIAEFAQKFGITHLLERATATLSGGEKQKINLIALLLTQPDVLLLDEPTAFLDPESAKLVIDVLAQYVHHKTIIIVEHNHHYLHNLVNRVITINSHRQINETSLSQMCWQQPYTTHGLASYDTHTQLLTIHNLGFSYPKQSQLLLKSINLTVHRGEIAIVQGKNGAGKSTLLQLIAKLIPTQHIYFCGKSIGQLSQKQYWQEISLLWQNPENQFLFNSVSEELNDNQQLLEEFNLTKQKSQSPYCLSEGQKRRLSLAIGMLKSAKLFLLDEPTFGQDYNNKQILINKITALAKQGHTFLIISHDDSFNRAIAHTRYELANGILKLLSNTNF